MKKSLGLTLIELMVTLAVAIILVAVGVPLFGSLVSNNALVADTNEVVSALNLARSEAVKRNATVTICAKSAANVTNTTCGTTWTNGWQVFVDANGDGVRDSGDDILRNWEPRRSAAAMTVSTGAITFSGTGTAASAERTFEVGMSGTNTNTRDRCIRVAASGVIRTHKVTTTATCP